MCKIIDLQNYQNALTLVINNNKVLKDMNEFVDIFNDKLNVNNQSKIKLVGITIQPIQFPDNFTHLVTVGNDIDVNKTKINIFKNNLEYKNFCDRYNSTKSKQHQQKLRRNIVRKFNRQQPKNIRKLVRNIPMVRNPVYSRK
jgi:hypothetical protein